MEPRNGPLEDEVPAWRTGSQRKRAVGMPGRVPVVHCSISEMDDDDSDGRQVKRREALISSCLSRQTSGSSALFTLSSAKKRVEDGDFLNLKTPIISPEPRPWKDMGIVDSATTLLHRQDRRDATRMEDSTDNINQIIGSNSPEACRMYLTKLEKRGNPQTDTNLLLKLKDCYSRVFSRLPLGMYSNNESYAKMLVRFAELKDIDDPDDARDNFIVARSNCKGFAFVHIAHAQFEVARGQVKKGTSVLQKAQVKAKPTELIETAMHELKAGNSPRRRQRESPNDNGFKLKACKPDEKHTPPDFRPIPGGMEDSLPTPSLPLPSRHNPPVACQTPNYKDTRANSYVTPVVKRNPPYAAPLSAAHKAGPAQQQPCTPLSQVSYAQQTHQGSAAALSNESIVMKGKRFLVLKMIGRGGSSKVYQVLDQRNHLFAVKYVNLEEADAQTVESYKNEIEHLNRLQQYSDQIIKLYDYEAAQQLHPTSHPTDSHSERHTEASRVNALLKGTLTYLPPGQKT
uniref:Ttk protein kinase n=2 Tax=Hucho hucho TaxID=62062 RepID=A0A4W5RMK6_9TELE